jgi:protein-S-isoprenylcysteine O-methyltransferase Ste14
MESYNILAQYLPDIKSWRFLVLLVIGTFSYLVPWWIMRAVDRIAPAWSGAVQVGLLVAAYLWLRLYFRRKQAYTERWGKWAYRQAFIRHILTGLPAFFAVIVHIGYLPGERIIPGWMALPVEILAWYMALTGFILDLRAIFTLGWDTLALMYVYLPEKGHLVNSSIYQIIRHPVYSAMVRIGLALGLLRGTLLSILFGLILPNVLSRLEEPDLIARFGEGYREFRRKTPALWPRLKDLGKFWRFLLLGDRLPKPVK